MIYNTSNGMTTAYLSPDKVDSLVKFFGENGKLLVEFCDKTQNTDLATFAGECLTAFLNHRGLFPKDENERTEMLKNLIGLHQEMKGLFDGQ